MGPPTQRLKSATLARRRPSVWLIPCLLLASTLSVRSEAAEFPRSSPIAQASYNGNRVILKYHGLSVSLDKGESHDPLVCHSPKDASFVSCLALAARGKVGGKAVFVMWGPASDELEIDPAGNIIGINVALYRLSPTAALPQAILSYWTGGAHCCISTLIATQNRNRAWRVIDAGQVDGDGYEFLDLRHNGGSELVDADYSFNYHFASYADSFAPTCIFQLQGGHLKNVTHDPAYRAFLIQRLHEMEDREKRSDHQYINGYLAGWVAQEALVGELDNAWQTMLASYDRRSTLGVTYCRIDESAWKKTDWTYGYPPCPQGQEVIVPFPEALALFLTGRGYLTRSQSRALGYDVPKIMAKRRAAIEEATTEYKQLKPP